MNRRLRHATGQLVGPERELEGERQRHASRLIGVSRRLCYVSRRRLFPSSLGMIKKVFVDGN
jgi:hypothetical protein